MSHSLSIGQWTCPSGNQVEVLFTPNTLKGGEATFMWDEGPPLRPDDQAYYLQVIRPQALSRVLALTSQQKQSIFHPKGDLR